MNCKPCANAISTISPNGWQTWRVLTLAQDKGQLLKRLEPHSAAVGLHALMDGLMANWLLQTEAFDLEVVGAQALDAYLAERGGCANAM